MITLILAMVLTAIALYCYAALFGYKWTGQVRLGLLGCAIIATAGAGLCWWALQDRKSGYSDHNTEVAEAASGYIPHQRDLP